MNKQTTTVAGPTKTNTTTTVTGTTNVGATLSTPGSFKDTSSYVSLNKWLSSASSTDSAFSAGIYFSSDGNTITVFLSYSTSNNAVSKTLTLTRDVNCQVMPNGEVYIDPNMIIYAVASVKDAQGLDVFVPSLEDTINTELMLLSFALPELRGMRILPEEEMAANIARANENDPIMRAIKGLENSSVNVMSPSEAASVITNANRTGSALKGDAYHTAPSFVTEDQLSSGQTFNLQGGDGVRRTLLQVNGEVNGKAGVFEYIIEPDGTVSHQQFKPGGVINGIPKK